jgi:hypothetical protein
MTAKGNVMTKANVEAYVRTIEQGFSLKELEGGIVGKPEGWEA